jgi:uncharacterized protein (TIGR00369 family)
MNIDKLTGLEILQATVREELPIPSMCNTLPMHIVEVEKGRVVFQATASDKHLNPMGGVHGGFAAAVLDSVTGCVVHSMLGAGIGYGTIDLSIKMMRPIPCDEILVAEGTIINISKSLGISEARLKNKEGKLLATATATCMILSS